MQYYVLYFVTRSEGILFKLVDYLIVQPLTLISRLISIDFFVGQTEGGARAPNAPLLDTRLKIHALSCVFSLPEMVRNLKHQCLLKKRITEIALIMREYALIGTKLVS